jgi:hypothetical protein
LVYPREENKARTKNCSTLETMYFKWLTFEKKIIRGVSPTDFIKEKSACTKPEKQKGRQKGNKKTTKELRLIQSRFCSRCFISLALFSFAL